MQHNNEAWKPQDDSISLLIAQITLSSSEFVIAGDTSREWRFGMLCGVEGLVRFLSLAHRRGFTTYVMET